MKKKMAPFISGIGTGLCMAVVIMTIWGFIWPDNEEVQASNFEENLAVSSEIDPAQEANSSLPDQGPSMTPDISNQENPLDPPPKQYKDVEIRVGMTANQISELLAQEGLINNAQEFHDFVVEQKKTQRFIAGRFTVPYNTPYEELISLLTSQPSI